MIDTDGYRPNVGIVLVNADSDKVLWARRLGQDAWQFPQGGIKRHETPEVALFRELGGEQSAWAGRSATTHAWRRSPGHGLG